MEAYVFVAVLGAALCHAGWNALVKLKLEPLQSITLVSVAAGLVGLPLLFTHALPRLEAWPFLIGSLIIHMGYYLALAEAYRSGDLGQVYPIARGSAPLITGDRGEAGRGRKPAAAGWIGLICLTSGVLLRRCGGGRAGAGFQGRAVFFALLTALSIALYTIVDGLGGRASGDVVGYIGWLMVLDGVMMAALGLWLWGQAPFRHGARGGFAGARRRGALLHRLRHRHLGHDQGADRHGRGAARDLVLFAALIGMLLLKEPLVPIRLAAAAIVFAGAAMLRLA